MNAKKTPTRTEAARMLADDHFATDDDLMHFFQLRTPREAGEQSPLNPEPEQFTSHNPFLKVLEVVAQEYEDGIRPLYFSGSTDVHGTFWPPLMLIKISPREFTALQRGELELPDGLKLEDSVELLASSTVGVD